tara:strand:+ start:303 stop:1691 length:1389 start_codon:yes stop_codon:yes gene_type:complete
MNVSEIRQRIFDQMDYFPDLQQYRDSVVRRMNDRYQELCDSAHWLFLQKEREITVRAAVEGSSDDSVGIQVTSSSNPRKVTAVGFTPTLEMEGQTLTNTTTEKEFIIVRVDSSSTFFINDDWDGTSDGSTVYNWKVTFQRFMLPEDCIEVLGYMDRDADRGKLLFVGRRREEFAYLDADNSGDSGVVIEDEHIIDDPPLAAPVLSTLAYTTITNNMLQQGTTYEYRYTIYREGRESPPSLVREITTPTGSNNYVNLGDLDNTGFYATSSATSTTDSGMYKHIYRRDKTNDGKWMLVGSVSSTASSFNDQELIARDGTTSFLGGYQNSTSYRYSSSTEVLRWADPGPRQYVRFWYTPGADKVYHLRYHYRPKDLVADNDVPEMPRQYHNLLVYITLQDMFLQMQDLTQSQVFERRAEQVKIQLRRRFLTRDDQNLRFKRFDRPRGGRGIGTPSIVHLYPNVVL